MVEARRRGDGGKGKAGEGAALERSESRIRWGGARAWDNEPMG